MIPREVIEEIKYRNDIVEVISSYVTLKRAGSNYNGLCPFHSEKTPSFTVFPATSSFYCFGCGAGGEVITFIMKTENLDYLSAVEFLAKRAGIRLPENSAPSEKSGVSRQRVLDMNLAAAKFFRNCLYDEKLGKAGMEYLSGKRELTGSTIRHFGLGFAPEDFYTLTDYLHRQGYTDEEMIQGFMAKRSQQNGELYPMFRNRVIFPVIDTTGNIVAFGGRVMDDSKPKYLNTSDTPAFKKSHHLFALNYAKGHCAEQMILCEGYMDVIAMHAAGFENAVATLGTAITPEQARIFARYTKKVIISYDADEAGQTAANKAMRLLGEVGLDVRVLKMTGAKDPDEYIKKFGAAKFKNVIDSSRTGFDFKLEKVLNQYDLSLPDDKIKATNDVCDVISTYYSPVEQEIYINEASKKLEMPPDVLKNDVAMKVRQRLKEQKKQEGHAAEISIRNVGDRVNPDAMKNVQAAAAEEAILGLLMIRSEYRAAVRSGRIRLSKEDFITEFGKKVFDAVMSQDDVGELSLSYIGQEFTPDEIGRMEKMRQTRMGLTENGEDVLKDCVGRLKDALEKENSRSSGDLYSDIERLRSKLIKK